MPIETADSDDSEREAPASGRPMPPADGVGEVLRAVPLLGRVGWFALGALVGGAVTLLAVLRPIGRSTSAERAPPYEGFPFADNAGVCQEHVALATLQTTQADAQAIAQRLAGSLPPDLRPSNLRVVRAFVPGELWTVAVDAEPGMGTPERAAQVAASLNTVAGTGLHFEPVFYSARRLYDTARVLCMPRAASGQ
jgi:hypothetical protein